MVDPEGQCSKPARLAPDLIGVCIDAFIKAPYVPLFGGLAYATGDIVGAIETLPGVTMILVAKPNGLPYFVPIMRDEGGAKTDLLAHYVDDNGNTHVELSTRAWNALWFVPGSPSSIDFRIHLIITRDGRVGHGGIRRDRYPTLSGFRYWAFMESTTEVINTVQIFNHEEGELIDLEPPEEEVIPPSPPQ